MSLRSAFLCCLFSGVCLGAGCGTAAETVAPGPRLILKFKPATLACDKAGVARVARESGLQLRLVRPMSGDACLVALGPDEKTATAVARLSALPVIEWAEPDAIMRAN